MKAANALPLLAARFAGHAETVSVMLVKMSAIALLTAKKKNFAAHPL
jgi:hypothetical protein